MINRLVPVVFLIFICAGCATSSSHQIVQMNPQTGKQEIIKYADYFEGEDFLIDDLVTDVIKVFAVAKGSRMSKNQKSQMSGGSMPVDFKVSIMTTGKTSMTFNLNSVELERGEGRVVILKDAKSLNLIPKSVLQVVTDQHEIDKSELSLTLMLRYNIKGKYHRKNITLKRLTRDEYINKKDKIWNNITGNIL